MKISRHRNTEQCFIPARHRSVHPANYIIYCKKRYFCISVSQIKFTWRTDAEAIQHILLKWFCVYQNVSQVNPKIVYFHYLDYLLWIEESPKKNIILKTEALISLSLPTFNGRFPRMRSPSSASFLAKTSVRSPQKLFTFITWKKNPFRIKVSKKTFYLILKIEALSPSHLLHVSEARVKRWGLRWKRIRGTVLMISCECFH